MDADVGSDIIFLKKKKNRDANGRKGKGRQRAVDGSTTPVLTATGIQFHRHKLIGI